MARPGYVEARKARDKEFYALEESKQRLAKVDTLEDKEGNPYSDALKELHRKDAETAVQKHTEALALAEATFTAFAKSLPSPKIPVKRFDVILGMQLSVTREMFDAVAKECEERGIRKTELIRNALEVYFNPQADGKPVLNVRQLFSGKSTV